MSRLLDRVRNIVERPRRPAGLVDRHPPSPVIPTLPGADPRQPPAEDPPASPAARAHRQQLARVARLRAQLAELDALDRAHRAEHMALIAPLRARHVQARKGLVRLLHEALESAARTRWLSGTQAATARARLCALAQDLAEDGHADMAALHDRHSPQSLAHKRQARADELRGRFEAALGAPLDGLDGASPEAVLHAGWQRLREASKDQREGRQKKRAARRARQAPAGEALPAPAAEVEADTLLRRLYRQLASALHPDREPEALARQLKTALMSEANAAYDRRDLLALMEIQQRAALADTGPGASMGEERLAALSLLLKRQVAALERERAAAQEALARRFELPEGVSANANTLRQARIAEAQRLERELVGLEHTLERGADEAGLKRWLNGLRQAAGPGQLV